MCDGNGPGALDDWLRREIDSRRTGLPLNSVQPSDPPDLSGSRLFATVTYADKGTEVVRHQPSDERKDPPQEA